MLGRGGNGCGATIGRLGQAYRDARAEEELTPLREEFAVLVRQARARTGRPLRVASTMTVTRDNLAGVPAVMRWLARNTDVFRLISFQPVAQVGRTEDHLGDSVAVDALWDAIAEGLHGTRAARGELEAGQLFLGHPACSRYLPGVVLNDRGGPPAFHPIRSEHDPVRSRYVDGFLDRFGGVSFRLDTRMERLARTMSLVLREPRFLLGSVGPFLWQWCKVLAPREPARLAGRLMSGRSVVSPLVVISHHFMSRAQAESPQGRERLDISVFQVSVQGDLVPMCQVNALGVRERYYATLTRAPAGSPPTAGMPG
jgi:hypothetical protein